MLIRRNKMTELLTVKMIQEEYGLSRRKVDELLYHCNTVPRVPGGKIRVVRSEFEKVLRGEA